MKTPAGFSWPRREDRDQARLVWRLIPARRRQIGKQIAEVIDGHGAVGVEENVDWPWTTEGFGIDLARRGGMTGVNAGLCDEAERRAAVLKAVDQREGNIFLICQAALDCRENLLSRYWRRRARRPAC